MIYVQKKIELVFFIQNKIFNLVLERNPRLTTKLKTYCCLNEMCKTTAHQMMLMYVIWILRDGAGTLSAACPILPLDKHWLNASTQQMSACRDNNSRVFSDGDCNTHLTQRKKSKSVKNNQATVLPTFWSKTQSVHSIVMPVLGGICVLFFVNEVSPVAKTKLI